MTLKTGDIRFMNIRDERRKKVCIVVGPEDDINWPGMMQVAILDDMYPDKARKIPFRFVKTTYPAAYPKYPNYPNTRVGMYFWITESKLCEIKIRKVVK
jgi:hypothetical protein